MNLFKVVQSLLFLSLAVAIYAAPPRKPLKLTNLRMKLSGQEGKLSSITFDVYVKDEYFTYVCDAKDEPRTGVWVSRQRSHAPSLHNVVSIVSLIYLYLVLFLFGNEQHGCQSRGQFVHREREPMAFQFNPDMSLLAHMLANRPFQLLVAYGGRQ